MSDLPLSVLIAIALSALIAAIELSRGTGLSLRRCITTSAALYFAILAIGNVATTLLASATLPNAAVNLQTGGTQAVAADPPTSTSMSKLAGLGWFWPAFIGVFAFEVLLQNLNISFLGRGVLSINDWISKAREIAVAEALKNNVARNTALAQELATKLARLDEATLNTHVTMLLGQEKLQELERIAENSKANPRLIKALALAQSSYEKASVIPVAD